MPSYFPKDSPFHFYHYTTKHPLEKGDSRKWSFEAFLIPSRESTLSSLMIEEISDIQSSTLTI
jgi:hypothetical protein